MSLVLKTYVFVAIMLIMGLFSCMQKSNPTPIVSEPLWIYITFNTLDGDTLDELYMYYGTIDKEEYIKLSTNTLEGNFIRLNNIRYDGLDDKLHIYESDFEIDEFLINKDCIKGIDVLKMDPIVYYPENELDETALRFKRGFKVGADSVISK